MNLNRKSGFTLLEIIIVIIIVGVLASLALPRFFATVEYSRATEALNQIGVVRASVERCYLIDGDYTQCTAIAALDIEDPGQSIGTHFTYTITAASSTEYTITANRNTYEGGDNSSTVNLRQTASTISRWGTGKYSGIK